MPRGKIPKLEDNFVYRSPITPHTFLFVKGHIVPQTLLKSKYETRQTCSNAKD